MLDENLLSKKFKAQKVEAGLKVRIYKDFGRIQIDRIAEMQKWSNNINIQEDERFKLSIVAVNNHYAGFGPGTANIFRNMLGLPEAKWEDQVEEQREVDHTQERQRTLSDFLS